jgi:hypothetical protein
MIRPVCLPLRRIGRCLLVGLLVWFCAIGAAWSD